MCAKQEAALHVWDLAREGELLRGVSIQVAPSARSHDRPDVDCAVLDRVGARVKAQGAVILNAPAHYSLSGAGDAAMFETDPDGLKREAVHLPG